MADSTRLKKPAKPRPDFPLFPHASGRWAKKVRGKFHYFGKVADDPKGVAALDLWNEQKDDLLAGRTPRPKGDGPTVGDLVNKFLRGKELKRDSGAISHRTFLDYLIVARFVVESLGKSRLLDDIRPDDFTAMYATLVKRKYNPNTIANCVQRVRVMFKFADDEDLITRRIKFGTTFKKPEKKVLRALRQKHRRTFDATELRTIIKAAPQPLKAMIYLGINCGYGNSDCGNLTMNALDLDGGWVSFPRPKTAIERRCPLWDETIAAIREAIAERPEPKSSEHANLVFITRFGFPWAKLNQDGPISKEFTKLTKRLGLHAPGLGFYALRRGMETIGGGCKDQVAVDYVMGHADETMAAVYRDGIDDSRLQAVVGTVHAWLFPRPTVG